MNCPKCRSGLKTETYEGVEIDRCPACRGVWLDHDELRAILEASDEKFTPEETAKALAGARAGLPAGEHKNVNCPKCSAAMTPNNFSYNSGIIIDVCKRDGIWLETGEIESLQAFHEAWNAKKPELQAKFAGELSKGNEGDPEARGFLGSLFGSVFRRGPRR